MSIYTLYKDITIRNQDTHFSTTAAYDMNVGEQNIATSVSSVATRQIENLGIRHSMPNIHIPEEFRIDAKPFINRPFFLTEVKWNATSPKHTLLPNTIQRIPRDIVNSNLTLLNGLKMGSLYRYQAKLNISVAGTITHAGCILAGVIPPTEVSPNYSFTQKSLINTILSGPHAFLHANEATSVLIDIPWYCNTDLDSLDLQVPSASYINPISLAPISGNFGTLVFMVLNPLQPSEGSSTTLSIIVECIFDNLDILVPTPRYVSYVAQSFSTTGTSVIDSAAKFAKTLTGDAIDELPKGLSSLTGLHNPNTPQLGNAMYVTPRNRLNNIDTTQYLENLDPNAYSVRTVQEPIFNTDIDEMAINHIISKRQFLGTFSVAQNDAVGKLLWVRPISPFQGGFEAAHVGSSRESYLNGNIELMHYLTRAWKGSIKITIQSVMNNKQQVKLRLLQMYNPSTRVLTGYPTYATILQAPSHLMEFSQGGQEQSVILPYLCRNKLMNCARESNFEALFHGLYYIYVAQPLANSSGSPINIFFNVYMELEKDFHFYGYSTELTRVFGPFNSITPGRTNLIENTQPPNEQTLQPPEQIDEKVKLYVPQSIEVMNKPQTQAEPTVNRIVPVEDLRLQPVLDIRPLIRRLYHAETRSAKVLANKTLVDSVSLSDYIGEISGLASTPAGAIAAMSMENMSD